MPARGIRVALGALGALGALCALATYAGAQSRPTGTIITSNMNDATASVIDAATPRRSASSRRCLPAKARTKSPSRATDVGPS
ncbi:MAG: hypothetical protein ACREPM_00455 [Gemmatimonadaceae bacterium]